MEQIKKIIIAGEGGQGIQTIAHAFARAAFLDDLNVSFMPNYGVEQRGGVSL
jgi:2-oxoglutarate ferredoxin oxidoreductase subunit gamma